MHLRALKYCTCMNIIQYIFLGHYLPGNSVPDVLQTLANFHTSYTMEDLAQVGIEYTYVQVLCILCMHSGVHMKSKLQHTGTSSVAAWQPWCLCPHPPVFLHHLVSLYILWSKIWCAFKNVTIFLTSLKSVLRVKLWN